MLLVKSTQIPGFCSRLSACFSVCLLRSLRMLKRLTISVLLGLATAVAVAWGCAVLVDPYAARAAAPAGGSTGIGAGGGQLSGGGSDSGSGWSRPSGVGDGWSYWIARSQGAVVVQRAPARFNVHDELAEAYQAVRQREVPGWSKVHQPPVAHERTASGTWIEDARGWPWLCLRSETAFGTNQPAEGDPSAIRAATRWGIRLSEPTESGTGSLLVLPLKPIWSGMTLNTTAYALGWFIVLFLPGVAVRYLRHRTGRCPACGYDRRYTGEEAACPECGAA